MTFSDYDRFAWLYNKYWGSYFVDNVFYIMKDLVLKKLSNRANILDLCCGAGQLSHALSTRGYRVTGVDGSAEMLRYARKNAPGCRFLHADARRFRLRESFDAVLSTFDSLNHVVQARELERVFRNVNLALKKGGLFLFDLNMDDGFRARWRGSFGIVGRDHACVIRSSYDPKTKTGMYNITMFFRKRRGWNRSDLRLKERCYREAEVKSALRRAGFGKVRSYDSQRDLKFPQVGRTFFLCEK